MSPNQEPKKARARKSAPPKSAPRRKRERWRGARHLQSQPQPASQPGARARPPTHPPAASAAGLREAGREARECTATLSRGLLGCFGWGARAGARFFDGTVRLEARPAGARGDACTWPAWTALFLLCGILRDLGGETAGGKKTAEKFGLGGCAGASSARAGAAGGGGARRTPSGCATPSAGVLPIFPTPHPRRRPTVHRQWPARRAGCRRRPISWPRRPPSRAARRATWPCAYSGCERWAWKVR